MSGISDLTAPGERDWLKVSRGVFGAAMAIEMTADGPVSIVLE